MNSVINTIQGIKNSVINIMIFEYYILFLLISIFGGTGIGIDLIIACFLDELGQLFIIISLLSSSPAVTLSPYSSHTSLSSSRMESIHVYI